MLSMLIFQIGTLKLVYRSFKTLQGFEENQNKAKNGALVRKNQENIQALLSENEWEVLTLWALYGVHYVYCAFQVETVVECFVPFYHYIKIAFVMFVWVVPSRNQIPSFLLHSFVVPAIDQAHVFLCDTLEQINYHVIVRRVPLLLPLFLLDLVFPGIISRTCSEDDNEFILERPKADIDVMLDDDDLSGVPYAVKLKRLRWQQLLQARTSSDECMDAPQLIKIDSMSTLSSGTKYDTTERCRSFDGFESSLDSIVEHSDVQNYKQLSLSPNQRPLGTHATAPVGKGEKCKKFVVASTSSKESSPPSFVKGCESTSMSIDSNFDCTEDDDDSLAALLDQNIQMEEYDDDGMSMFKVRGYYQRMNLDDEFSSEHALVDNDLNSEDISNTSDNVDHLIGADRYLRQDGVKKLALSELPLSVNEQKSRQLVESSLLLRRFSRDHQVTPRKTDQISPAIKTSSPTQSYGNSHKNYGVGSDDENVSPSGQRSRRVEGTPPTSSKSAKKKKKRRSLGDRFRSLVTGNSNTRLRDYLFDLDLPQNTLCGSAGYSENVPLSDIPHCNQPHSVDHIRKFRNRLDMHSKKDERRRRSVELLRQPLEHEFSVVSGNLLPKATAGNKANISPIDKGEVYLSSAQSRENSTRRRANTKGQNRLPSPRKVRNELRRSKRISAKSEVSKPNSEILSDLIRKCE